MVSLPDLGERLQGAGLLTKSFQDCTRTEILFICESVFSCIGDDVPAEGWSKPTIEDGKLRIPFDCHPDYRWWTHEGLSIHEILNKLGAPFEMAVRYIPNLTQEAWMNELIPF